LLIGGGGLSPLADEMGVASNRIGSVDLESPIPGSVYAMMPAMVQRTMTGRLDELFCPAEPAILKLAAAGRPLFSRSGYNFS
jgi:hypothetical protein